MSGAQVYQMVSGLGDAFADAYAGARKQAQEDEAPAAMAGLMKAMQGGAGATPAAATPDSPVSASPTFARVSGANPSAAPRISGTNADFVAAMMPHAIEASKATGIDPRIILAQSAIETGWGTSAPGNNYFGIKSHGMPGGNVLATNEEVNGQNVRIKDSFRAYPSMADSARGYADFILQNPRYRQVQQAQGLDAQAAALQRSGYASSGEYGASVLQIARGLPAPGAGAQAQAAPRVEVAENEDQVRALERRQIPQPSAAPMASTTPADTPAPGAQPTGFTIPQAQPEGGGFTGFAGFGGGGATRLTPELRDALNVAWKNPNTRSMAASVFSNLLTGKGSEWSLGNVGDQPVLFNPKTAQVVPIGQPKRSTATVDGAIVDTQTGQPIYQAPDKPITVASGSSLYDRSGRLIATAPAAEKPEKDEGAKITAQIDARRAQAESLGLVQGTPAWQSFVGTGKIGRDQDLSATDKKAIQEADEGVLSAQTAIDALKQAKALSPKAYEGLAAGERGYVGSLVGSDAAVATEDLKNVVTSNALGQLKSIFGAAPTEGERKILLEIQGSVNQPDIVRQKIYERAQALAERRLEFNRRRAEDLRGGTFYKRDGEAGPAPRAALPRGEERAAIPGGKSAAAAVSEARAFVKANPSAKADVADRLRSWGIDPTRLDQP